MNIFGKIRKAMDGVAVASSTSENKPCMSKYATCNGCGNSIDVEGLCKQIESRRSERDKLQADIDEHEDWELKASKEIMSLKFQLSETQKTMLAYRQVAMENGHVCHSKACLPECEMGKIVDAEALRLVDRKDKF